MAKRARALGPAILGRRYSGVSKKMLKILNFISKPVVCGVKCGSYIYCVWSHHPHVAITMLGDSLLAI